jgi:hypothetical protein
MDSIDEQIEYYIEKGYLIPDGEEDGQRILKISPTAETEAPMLYRAYMRGVEDEIIELVQAGYVEIDFLDDGTPTYQLTPLGVQYAALAADA